jgi:hypothetical protein
MKIHHRPSFRPSKKQQTQPKKNEHQASRSDDDSVAGGKVAEFPHFVVSPALRAAILAAYVLNPDLLTVRIIKKNTTVTTERVNERDIHNFSSSNIITYNKLSVKNKKPH